MAHYNLTQVLVDDKPARYYANSRRVSRDQYDHIIRMARMDASGHIDCFATKAKQLPGGHFKRWNYCCARW